MFKSTILSCSYYATNLLSTSLNFFTPIGFSIMSEFCSKSFLFSLLTLFIALYVNLDISGFLKIDEEFQSIKELVLAWDNIIPKNKNDFTFKKIAVG